MNLKVIISKELAGFGYRIQIKGHYPNDNFKSIVSGRLDTYKEAYRSGRQIEHVLRITNNQVELVNDKYAEQDGNDYCDLMAFERLNTLAE